MRKVITILAIFSIILSSGLVYLMIKAQTSGIPIFDSLFIINEKYFGEPADIRFWITPDAYAIRKQAEELKTDNEIATITKTYNWLESGYHYEEDDLVILNNGHIVLRGGVDSWNLPIFTLAIKHQNNGEAWMDCEDGAFLLTSLLRANNIDAWANIGTVSINGNLYGHAWVTVNVNGKEYLLETTLGQSLTELRPVPSFYKGAVKFNEKEVIAITGEDINKQIYPPLPPSKIQDLKNLLNKSP
jgi:hypothetical protein